MLYKEPNWKLIEEGEPLPFEQVAAYKAPRKRDRLTLAMLRNYAVCAGIQISDPAAYGDQVIVLREEQQQPEDVKTSFARLQKIFGPMLRLLHPRIADQGTGPKK
jgi:hypothetical protein